MSLSDKRLKGSPHYYEDDVKEFIRELKEQLDLSEGEQGIIMLIDLLAGEKLI